MHCRWITGFDTIEKFATSCEDSFFILSGAAVGRRLHVDSIESIFYASTWFIASQVVLLGALYAFTRVDWKTLFDQRKFAWVPKPSTPPEGAQ